jgi:hypothetical protein
MDFISLIEALGGIADGVAAPSDFEKPRDIAEREKYAKAATKFVACLDSHPPQSLQWLEYDPASKKARINNDVAHQGRRMLAQVVARATRATATERRDVEREKQIGFDRGELLEFLESHQILHSLAWRPDYNGREINWNFWTSKMVRLTAGQAARLMRGLDPEIFETLNERPNLKYTQLSDPREQCGEARRIEQVALSRDMGTGTAIDWLRWADSLEIPVCNEFRLAVARIVPDAAVPFTNLVPKATSRVHALDAEIAAAKKKATAPNDIQSVYSALKEMALEEKGPFTGVVNEQGLEYTTNQNKKKLFTLGALRQRMKRRDR